MACDVCCYVQDRLHALSHRAMMRRACVEVKLFPYEWHLQQEVGSHIISPYPSPSLLPSTPSHPQYLASDVALLRYTMDATMNTPIEQVVQNLPPDWKATHIDAQTFYGNVQTTYKERRSLETQ